MKAEVRTIKRIVGILNKARHEYYNGSNPSLTDAQYDALFDELAELEKKTGLILNNSPTQTVGYEAVSELSKVVHEYPMLSLDKTKSVDDAIRFIGDRKCLMMLKMDGLTVALTYINGELTKAETRGDGFVGEDILHTAKTFSNIPKTIPYRNKLVISGEAIITFKDFERINAPLPIDEKYANPRNLCSGTVRQLNSAATVERGVKFIAWRIEEGDTANSFVERLRFCKHQGFDVVPHIAVDRLTLLTEAMELMKGTAATLSYPIDGLVIGYDDVAYGKSLGATGHHLKSQLAFKFEDTVEATTLKYVDWTMGTTGALTPTAVFVPVELEGTTVERASLHNISVMESLNLKNGCTVNVYKANQIIPQILSADKDGVGAIEIPDVCPICEGKTEIKQENESKVLFCTNDNCTGKLLGKMANYVSKKGMDITGLSKATLEKFIELEWITCFTDIYRLKNHKLQMKTLEGFGAKSVDKLLESIERSQKDVELEKFIAALGIPLIGTSASKIISKYCNGDVNTFFNYITESKDWTVIEDFGEAKSNALNDYVLNAIGGIRKLASMLTFKIKENNSVESNENSAVLSGLTFVVTGSVNQFKNRTELQEKIEALGGKCSGGVTGKTNYLINNDNASSSGKNKKAQELGVAIITEKEFLIMIGE